MRHSLAELTVHSLMFYIYQFICLYLIVENYLHLHYLRTWTC